MTVPRGRAVTIILFIVSILNLNHASKSSKGHEAVVQVAAETSSHSPLTFLFEEHVQQIAPSVVETKPVAKKKTWLQHIHFNRSRLKLVLTITCALCVAIELLEEMINDIPFLRHIVGQVGVHHGVLLLTVNHLVHHITDFTESIESLEDAQENAKKNSFVTSVAEKLFISDATAAHAYDKIALVRFGKSAAVNFNENLLKVIDLDNWILEFSTHSPKTLGVIGSTSAIKKPLATAPQKTSKFRGVIWNNDKSAWQVPLIAVDDPDDDED